MKRLIADHHYPAPSDLFALVKKRRLVRCKCFMKSAPEVGFVFTNYAVTYRPIALYSYIGLISPSLKFGPFTLL